MAIFNNSDIANTGSKPDANTTIITLGAKLKGEIDIECNLYIDGELEGSINSSKEINIGKNGHVKGTIKTERLVVQGLVEGSVDATRVEIKAGGHVNGEITSTDLIIESKGIFEGNSIVKDKKTASELPKKN
jgi:cytoskeletal protein CcmA (bactofilin family)